MILDEFTFDARLKAVSMRYHITIVLPFLLADEDLTAEEIEFTIEKFTGYSVRLDRLRILFESDEKRKKWKIDNVSSEILKEIKRLREEKGYGYQKISKVVYRRFGVYISGKTIHQLFKEGVDQIIEEKEKEERKIVEIEKAVEEGKIGEISLKELVWFAIRKDNDKVNAEIGRRLKELIRKSYDLTVLDVL
jgi:ribosomal protein L34E